MRSHERIHHMCTKSVQTEENENIKVDKKIQVKKSDFNENKCVETSREKVEKKFENYLCHYCGSNIDSEKHLGEHVEQCCGSHRPSFHKICKLSVKSEFNISRPNTTNRFMPPLPNLSLSSSSFNPPIGFQLPKLSETFPYPYQSLSHLPVCEQCGWKASCGTEMVEHMKSVHNDYRNPFDLYKHVY